MQQDSRYIRQKSCLLRPDKRRQDLGCRDDNNENCANIREEGITCFAICIFGFRKEKYFNDLVKGYNRSCSNSREKIKVKGFHGHEGRMDKRMKHHICICTIEKANGILNSFISSRNADMLGCVVIDEMHTLGSAFNGYLLEILVSKIRLLQYQATKAGFEGIKIQILGMSATVGNIQALSGWFGGDLFTTTFRPVPLSETIVAGENVYSTNKELKGSVYTNCFKIMSKSIHQT